MKAGKETSTGLTRPTKTMQTSLQSIANKAKEQKKYRFGGLYTMLNEANLQETWRFMNRNASAGIDRVTAREYEQNLHANIADLVDRLKGKRYKAKLVRRVNIPKGNGKTRPLGIPAVEDKLVQMATLSKPTSSRSLTRLTMIG